MEVGEVEVRRSGWVEVCGSEGVEVRGRGESRCVGDVG